MTRRNLDLKTNGLRTVLCKTWALIPLVLLTVFGAVGADGSPSKLTALPEPADVLHVTPAGNDKGDGSAQKPFATLERARDEVRAVKSKGPLPKGGIAVVVHGEEYPITKTFSLSAADSGTEAAPVVYRAATGERPVFRGGIRLRGWERFSDAAVGQKIPAAAHSNVWQIDLKPLGVTKFLPLKLGGFASGNGFKTHPAHELFFNGKAMQLARGPNEGFLRVAEIAVKDGTKGYDRQGSKTGQFIYTGDRPARWKDEPDLLLYGYWFWDWADSYERVASIDPEKRLITLAKPWHTYGFAVNAPFYAVNALTELDAAGEWYLDRSKGRLFFYAPSDPNSATVELSLVDTPMMRLENVSNMRFEGLTWEFGSVDGIQLKGGSNCVLAGCTVRHFAGNGIEIQGGKAHGLVSCDIYSMGRGGTVVTGGNRKTLEPGSHFVENCDIHDLSRIDHTYTPAVLLNGVGNRLAHNRFHDVLSSAMRIEGNDHLIEYNEIFNAVLESDDQGGADMFGNATYRGNVFRHNYWHHIGNWRNPGEPKCGQAGIRLDDAISGTLVYGNIFEHCAAGKAGFGGVQIHGGKDNVIDNNIFIDCRTAISCSPWPENRWQAFTKSALDAPAIDRRLYLERYPQLAHLGKNPNINRISRNLIVRCGEFVRRAPKGLEVTNNTILNDASLTLKADSPLFKQPGFDPIPLDKIGFYKDPWRK